MRLFFFPGRGIAATMLLLLLAACSSVSDAEGRSPAGEGAVGAAAPGHEAPEDGSAGAGDGSVQSCSEAEPAAERREHEVAVYFYCAAEGAEPGMLYPVVRRVGAGRDPLAAAAAALAAGPSEEERRRGFRSSLAALGEVEVIDVRSEQNGTRAVIDFTGFPDELPPMQRSFLPPGFMEEIAWTVFHHDERIESIDLRLDGRCADFWKLLTGEDCRMYNRSDWAHKGG